ncbi:hypothetical protein JQ594_08670 [Bradyrhizobium manausense]|uniref:hypothetical protein n=1 Tax=Bradyrhizobium manausense TaxID=989370 RepID=UPI001BA638DA|nr:hypothetical protein [Bradyrhizobium manausense]MBR0685987.1 hypothetical protein [Bradyrhizobium manausense]MBR0722928.1 hypothetical protein [Bradyrhizobium manausense]
MTFSEVDAQAKRELSAGELEQVAGGNVWNFGPPGRFFEPPLPPRFENAPQLGGGGLLKNPHLRLF